MYLIIVVVRVFFYLELKNKIIMFSYDEEEEDEGKEEERAVGLIKEINGFNKNYKRKPKKFRRLGAPNLDMLDSIVSEEVRRRVQAHEVLEAQREEEEAQKAEEEQAVSMAASSFSLAPFKCGDMEESVEHF